MAEFQVQQEPTQTVISIAGPRVDISSVSNLRKELLAYIDDAIQDEQLPANFVIDLGALTALDSTGVALLVNLQKKIRESGRQFHLLHVNDTIHKMLQLSNLTELFHII
jgi:anti-sigma B factor antagonist